MTNKQRIDGFTNEKAHQLGFFIADIEQSFAWYTGRALDSIKLQKKGNSWLMVVTVDDAGGRHVAFIDSPTPLGCYRTLYQLLSSRKLNLKPSKF